VGLRDGFNRRLDLAAKRNAAVFDEETQQWRFPDDDLSTGYRVAEGVSWLGSVGIIAAAVIAFVTWVGRRLRRHRA
jgi:hypothetical protein